MKRQEDVNKRENENYNAFIDIMTRLVQKYGITVLGKIGNKKEDRGTPLIPRIVHENLLRKFSVRVLWS